MRPAVVSSGVLAAIVVALWIPVLGGHKVPGAVEVAFYYGCMFAPVLGALLVLQPVISGPGRAGPIAALVVHVLLLAAYFLLIRAPVS